MLLRDRDVVGGLRSVVRVLTLTGCFGAPLLRKVGPQHDGFKEGERGLVLQQADDDFKGSGVSSA